MDGGDSKSQYENDTSVNFRTNKALWGANAENDGACSRRHLEIVSKKRGEKPSKALEKILLNATKHNHDSPLHNGRARGRQGARLANLGGGHRHHIR